MIPTNLRKVSVNRKILLPIGLNRVERDPVFLTVSNSRLESLGISEWRHARLEHDFMLGKSYFSITGLPVVVWFDDRIVVEYYTDD